MGKSLIKQSEELIKLAEQLQREFSKKKEVENNFSKNEQNKNRKGR